MPLTAAQTKTAMENTSQNPTGKRKRRHVQVELLLEEAEFNPKTFFIALETLFGANKVSSERDTVDRDSYIFKVIP
jgi:hypothetical protein